MLQKFDLQHTRLNHITLEPIGGESFDNSVSEGAVLALVLGCDVSVIHNEQTYKISYKELVKAIPQYKNKIS